MSASWAGKCGRLIYEAVFTLLLKRISLICCTLGQRSAGSHAEQHLPCIQVNNHKKSHRPGQPLLLRMRMENLGFMPARKAPS
eukprot:1152170-Pelagomonas_calceolata.AAC.15